MGRYIIFVVQDGRYAFGGQTHYTNIFVRIRSNYNSDLWEFKQLLQIQYQELPLVEHQYPRA